MIHIYGERNSCNNYLVKLILNNLKVNCDKSHGKPDKAPYTQYIILTKNPYAWLLSLHKKPHGPASFRRRYINLSFDDFLRAKWRGYDNSVLRYKDIMEEYYNFMKDKSVLWIKSEDLQRDPEAVLWEISQNFDIEWKGFQNVDQEVNSGGKLIGSFNRLDYYLKEQWKDDLTKGQIKTINKVLGNELFSKFNYKKL